jgi:predicted DNA-binding protein YlxM (UPF0122 family)
MGTLHEDHVHLSQYLIHFFSEWGMCQKKVIETKHMFMFNNFLQKLFSLRDNVEKYGTARQAAVDNIM